MQIVISNAKGGSGKSTLTAALAQVMDADILDHDNQGTLRITSSISGLNKPVKMEKITKKIVIHDTPPYNSASFKTLFKTADLIIIPCNVSYADLAAISVIVNDLRAIEAQNRGIIVLNRVRKPHNNSYKTIKEAFLENYKDIKKASVELSNLNGFLEIFAKPLSGKALQETTELYKELKAHLKIT